MPVLTVAEVKDRLNKTTNVDDAELHSMLEAAEAEYAELVGPIGTVSRPYYGGLFPRYSSGVVVTDANGNDVTATYSNQGSPNLYWNTWTGAMGHGLVTTPLTISYTATLPAHHREAILADVANYFAVTQRGSSPGALPVDLEGGTDDRTTPLVLFPRIRALARSLSGVA